MCVGDRRQIERHQGVSASVHNSLSRGREVDSLAHALPDFLEPRPWIGAVNHAPQKAQVLGYIVEFRRMSTLVILVYRERKLSMLRGLANT